MEALNVRPELMDVNRLPRRIHELYDRRHQVAQDMSMKCLRILEERQIAQVTILGCGFIGTTIIETLLLHEYPPSSLSISTRSPDKPWLGRPDLGKLVQRVSNNSDVCRSAHAVVLCVPPSQLPVVGKQMRKTLPPTSLVLSTLSGTSIRQLERTTGAQDVLALN